MRILTLVQELRSGGPTVSHPTLAQARSVLPEFLQDPNLDYLVFSEEADNVFLARPEGPNACEIRIQVKSKWFLGLIGVSSLEMNFGVLEVSDALFLLKLFYEGNYPGLKALEREMKHPK